MRFPRYLLALCALFFFAVVVSAEVDVEKTVNDVEDVDDVETRNPLLLRAAVEIIKQAVKWAAKHCLEEAAKNCKQHWKNPKALVKCGKAFLERNKGRCASG